MLYVIMTFAAGLLLLTGSVAAQDDTPEPPLLTINEVEEGNTLENTTYRVELEQDQVVLLVLQLIFDACLRVTGPDGDIIIKDNDVVEYGSVVLIPFVPPETGMYELTVGNFRCDPIERERTFLLYVVERDFPELGAEPLETFARHTEWLMTGELEAGTRYRLIMEVAEDLPPFRTLGISIAQPPYHGLEDVLVRLSLEPVD